MANNSNFLYKIKNAVEDKTSARRNHKVLISGIIERKNIGTKEDAEWVNQPVEVRRDIFDISNLDYFCLRELSRKRKQLPRGVSLRRHS